MTVSTSIKRLFAPCVRKRQTLLFVLILYGIATYFMRDRIWDAFSHIRTKTKTVFAETFTEEPPSRKLLFLQVLFRHGHHSPFSYYPNDPIPPDYWTEGFGQLTNLGRLQHYAVGQYLRKMYEDFLGYSVREVECMSSLAHRSMFGAYAFLGGFYPAPPGKRMADDVPYQPIGCIYEPIRQDKYLQSLPNCAASERDKQAMPLTKEAQEFMEGYLGLYQYWAAYSGLPIENYGSAGSLYKTLLAEKSLNLTIPHWAESTWESLKKNSNICYHFNFRTRLLHRLRAGPVIGEIIGKMKTKIQNPKSKLKVYVYSGHGSNVAAVLKALRVFNGIAPTYASTIVFELHQEVDGSHSVRLLFSNSNNPAEHIPPPQVLKLPGCGEYCPLEELERQTADLFPLDWEKECQEDDPNRVEKLINNDFLV